MREFTDGSTAIVRGALDAGCTFFAGYPITPASPILMQMMRELPKANGVAVQGEDEISAIGMCIGATLAGARAMTATVRVIDPAQAPTRLGSGQVSLYSVAFALKELGVFPVEALEAAAAVRPGEHASDNAKTIRAAATAG